jgi:hypothetical protein
MLPPAPPRPSLHCIGFGRAFRRTAAHAKRVFAGVCIGPAPRDSARDHRDRAPARRRGARSSIAPARMHGIVDRSVNFARRNAFAGSGMRLRKINATDPVAIEALDYVR